MLEFDELEGIKRRCEDDALRAARLNQYARVVGRARRDKETDCPVENSRDYDSIGGKAGKVLRLLPQARSIATMDAAARIQYAREILSSILPEERMEKRLRTWRRKQRARQRSRSARRPLAPEMGKTRQAR